MHKCPSTILTLTIAVAGVIRPDASAQAPQRVLQGVEDVSPLRKIEDDLYRDLRTPVGWDAVYRVPIKDSQGNVKWMYARRSGAISAIFPLSVYNVTKQGVEIAVPPGATFHVGPIESLSSAGDDSAADSSSSGGPPSPIAPPAPAKAPPLCVIEHEPYRQARMRHLLTQAATARVAIEADTR